MDNDDHARDDDLSGYLLVESTERFGERFDVAYYADLAGLDPASIDPHAYRGMGRHPMVPLQSDDPDQLADWRDQGIDVDTDQQARVKFWQLRGCAFRASGPEPLLATVEHALEVHGLVDDRDSWEPIEVSCAQLDPTDATIGFDIGYWTDDFESLIVGLLRAQDEELFALRHEIEAFNPNLLFDTPGQALAFAAATLPYRRDRNEDQDPVSRAFRLAGETLAEPEPVPVRVNLVGPV